jgi:hypothetical protein
MGPSSIYLGWFGGHQEAQPRESRPATPSPHPPPPHGQKLKFNAIRALLIGEEQRINKNPQKQLFGAADARRFAYRHEERAPLCL